MKFTKDNPFKLLETDKPFLEKIPEPMAQCLRLLNQGFPYPGIAQDLQVPIGTVKSRINRARAKILHLRAAARTGAANG